MGRPHSFSMETEWTCRNPGIPLSTTATRSLFSPRSQAGAVRRADTGRILSRYGTVTPKLHITHGLASATYSVTSSQTTIGRALANDFQIVAEGISRAHARIMRKGAEYWILDLQSKNGTFVNGHRVKEEKRRLKHGDIIELGRTVVIRFEEPGAWMIRESKLSELVSISNELNPPIESSIGSTDESDTPGLLDTLDIPGDIDFLKGAYKRLAILYEVNSSVSSLISLDELLERVGNIVSNLRKADRVAILLLDDATGELRPAVFRSKKPDPALGQIKVSRTIVEKAIAGRIGILSSDALSDPRFNSAESVEIQNVRSVMCAPLKRQDAVIGVIYVDCLFTSDSFNKEDLQLLMAVCNEASIVMENAYSYREIENLNRSLEEKVVQRTSELEKALDNLKSAQLRLVQSEKGAAIGQLVAGIAHEINNPVNYIVNGIESLTRYVNELRQMKSEYAEAARQKGADLKRAENLAADLNFDAHMDLLDGLLSAISDGAHRTAEIVEGLRSFSRTGEAEIKKIDINETLEKSLELLSTRLKDRVEVEKKLGEIPMLRCYASQMGQVFLNLLNNAQQAIEDSGAMTVKTWCDERNICISISDTGKGIAPEAIDKIFDPFFTTKSEGEGVGLGLSITRAIIERHGGRIDVESAAGSGTTFILTLPRAGVTPEGKMPETDIPG